MSATKVHIKNMIITLWQNFEKKSQQMLCDFHLDICSLQADPGFCNLIIGRWYYDHRYHRCLPFLYTGCGGNINNFSSLKKCEAATHQCHSFRVPIPIDPLTKYGLRNPVNPLGNLAEGYVLAG